MPSMIVTPQCSQAGTDGSITVRCVVEAPGLPRELWFRGAMSRAFTAPGEANWAVVGLLYPAMRLGLDLTVEGPVSAQLLAQVNHEVQALLRTYDPGLSRIWVRGSAYDAGGHPSRARVGTGYSAGIDSFATILHHRPGSLPSLHVTDLACFNVGAFGLAGVANAPDALFDVAQGRMKEYAAFGGYSWMTLDSNLDAFYACSRRFSRTHTLRNAAAALFFENEIGLYLYASGYPIGEVTARAGGEMARLDPALLPLVSTEKLQIRSSAGSRSRVERMDLLSRHEETYTRLDVCVAKSDERIGQARLNCTRCWKCARTAITLDCLGALGKYGAVFDLEAYRRTRGRLLNTVAHRAYRGSPVDREVLELLRRSGSPVPGRLRALLGSRR